MISEVFGICKLGIKSLNYIDYVEDWCPDFQVFELFHELRPELFGDLSQYMEAVSYF